MSGTVVPEQPPADATSAAGPVEHTARPANPVGDPIRRPAPLPIPSPHWPDWLIVAWFALIAAFAGVIGFFLLPMWIGSVPFPVGIVVAAAATALLPWPCYRLTGSLLAAAAPVVAWFVATVALLLVPNSVYRGAPPRIILPGYEWRLYLLLGLGTLAGAASLGLIWGDHLRRSLAAQRAVSAEASSPVAGPPGSARV